MPVTGPVLEPPRPDPDHLLAGYRNSRVHQQLLEVHDDGPVPIEAGTTGYDEFVDSDGKIRPTWSELGDLLIERGREGLTRLREVVRTLVDNDGITYVDIDPESGDGNTGGDQDGYDGAVLQAWDLDGIPLVLSAADWNILDAGVVQRSRLLDGILADLYGERRSITSGVLPPQLLFGHPGYLRSARGAHNPGRHQLFMLGCDISRAADGRFLVNADRTQAPSGAGYALADRRVVARAIPDVYERIGPRPASPFAQSLRLALIDAAPATAEDPVVVVLSPGIRSDTAFDQAYLATVLGFPLVESADLVVRDGKLWMRSLGTLKRVDVVLRRVDAEYADPLDLRPDSRLGVVGLVEAQRRGTVSVVNTLGSGILESPGLQRFLPELARELLGEQPLLDTPALYWGGIDSELSHLLARMESLLIKSAVGGRTIVGPTLSATERADLAARITAEPWQWVGQELPQFSSAPSDHRPGGLSAAGVGMRLFTVAQRNGYTPMVGGLGYVLAPGADSFTLKSVAAKDIWISPPTRATAEKVPVIPSMELPSGTKFISSPRVLSDMFWIGRYSERAEGTARLLIVTRERYHEYRNRPGVPAAECVPVLLDAVRTVSGTDSESPADGRMLLRSLTVDRHRPGSLAHSVERLGSAARAVRDQMSNDTWMVLGAVERVLAQQAKPQKASRRGGDDTQLANAQQRTLAGMVALTGVTAESMVHDAGWTMMDIGKRIERGLMLAALLRATLTTVRTDEAEQTITESALVACESAVIYRRLNLGRVSVAAVTDLVLLDEANPRSLIYQLERLAADVRALPGASGLSRLQRLIERIRARLRRLDPADLEEVDGNGRRAALDELLEGVHVALTELSDVITANQLSLPGDMQPLWGPDQRRVLP